jgi:hypothetical protein
MSEATRPRAAVRANLLILERRGAATKRAPLYEFSIERSVPRAGIQKMKGLKRAPRAPYKYNA